MVVRIKSEVPKISALAKQYGVVLGFVLLICIGALLSETFLSAQNLINILKQYAPIVVISCGTTLVIISGQIDLGAGSVVALSGCISVSTYLHTHALALAILAALCVGVLTGLINGFVITYYKLAPFIVTLAMQFMARGGALMFTNGIPLTLDDGFKVIGQGTLGFVPIAVVIMLAAIIANCVILNKTRLGRYVYAVGGNEDAAQASGINVKKIKIVIYILAGMFTGIAGIILAVILDVKTKTIKTKD